MLCLAQRYTEVRKGMVGKIVSCAADSILEVLLGKFNQQAEFLRTVFSSLPSCTSAFLCAMAKQPRAPSLASLHRSQIFRDL
jgi:hypothetical protein